MTTQYFCPISSCGWTQTHVATPEAADCPSDLLDWTPVNWASMSDRAGFDLAVGHVIDGHLATHSPVEWMTELRRERARAEDAEAQLDRLLDVLEQTADVAAGMHPVTSMRMPSRTEVEASAAVLAGTVNGGTA